MSSELECSWVMRRACSNFVLWFYRKVSNFVFPFCSYSVANLPAFGVISNSISIVSVCWARSLTCQNWSGSLVPFRLTHFQVRLTRILVTNEIITRILGQFYAFLCRFWPIYTDSKMGQAPRHLGQQTFRVHVFILEKTAVSISDKCHRSLQRFVFSVYNDRVKSWRYCLEELVCFRSSSFCFFIILNYIYTYNN